MSVRVVGLGGSLRETSASRRALQVALRAASGSDPAHVVTELLDLQSLALPLFDPEAATVPAEVEHLVEAVRSADAMIWSSPVYHGTVSGAFKNALDWLQFLAGDASSYLTDKPVGLIAVSAGARSSFTLHTMAAVVQALRGWTVPWTVGLSEVQLSMGPDGSIRDPGVVRQLAQLGAMVASSASRFAA